MTKINFIAIKKYPDKKEMHVFTKDGKEEVYPVSDGKEKINDNFRHLKELANQNEIPYSVKGLRELRRLGLVYYLEEKEFDRLYPVMSQGNKNQAQSQKKKEYLRAEKKKVKEYLTAVQKNPNLLLDSRRNPYFDTRKFYEKGSNSNGKEKQLPQLYKGIHDFILPREVPKTSFIMIKKPLNEKTKEEPLKMYVFTSDGEEKIYPVTKQNMARQLSKLAQENELSYSSKGLRELRRLGLLYYLEEEDFNQLYPIMSQKNKNQAQYQKKETEEAAEKQFLQNYNVLEEMIKRRAATTKNTTPPREKNADDLDSTKVKEFMHHEVEEKLPNTKKKNFKLKRVAMMGTILAMAISNVFSGGSSRTENRKVIESTVDSTKTSPLKGEKSQNMAQQTKQDTKNQEQKVASTKEESTNQKMANKQEMKEVDYKFIIGTLTSKKIIQKEKQKQKAEESQKTPNLTIVKSENTSDNTRMTGSQYKARLTNFWPDDGYGTGRVTGSGKTIYDFQVNEHGWYTYQGKLVIGTGTPYLLKYGYKQGKGVRLYEYYDELTLTIDGKNYPAIVLDSCGAAMKEKRIDLYIVGERYKKDTTIRVNENNHAVKKGSKAKQKVKTR